MSAPDRSHRRLLLALLTTLGLACQSPPPAAVSGPAAPTHTPIAPALPAAPAVMAGASAAPVPAAPERLVCTDRHGRSWEEPRVQPGAPPESAASSAKRTPLDRVLAAARGKIRACYQVALNTDASAEGRIAFRLQMADDGAVERWCIGAVGTIAKSSAVACIASTLADLRFAPPDKGAATFSGSFSFVDANPPPAQATP